MIKIIFAPGCYGTYLSRCIYQYTNLNQEEYQSFDFDSTGSSHDFRSNSYAKKIILCEHIDQYSSATKLDSDQLVVILPEPDHLLDYYNNQFVKQEKSQVVSYILKQFDQQTIKEKLRKNWDYIGLFDETVPRWILREWFSFWIQECLTTGANTKVCLRFTNLPAMIY